MTHGRAVEMRLVVRSSNFVFIVNIPKFNFLSLKSKPRIGCRQCGVLTVHLKSD